MEPENKPRSWSLRTKFKMAVANGFVRHRDMIYPRLVTAIWRRGDGLTVTIEVEMSPQAGAGVRRFTVEPEDGAIRPADFRQPIPSMAKRAMESLAFEPVGQGNADFPPQHPERVMVEPVPVRRTDDDRLERIARLVKESEAAGENIIAGIIREEPGVRSRGHAYNLVSAARAAGHLPKSGPGRKPKRGDN